MRTLTAVLYTLVIALSGCAAEIIESDDVQCTSNDDCALDVPCTGARCDTRNGTCVYYAIGNCID
jgi:hypothetical protein